MYTIKDYDSTGTLVADRTSLINRYSILLGAQADKGQADTSGLTINIDDGVVDPIRIKRIWQMVENATASPTILFRGRLQLWDTGRGEIVYGDATAPDLTFADCNIDLKGIICGPVHRPAETDVTRARWVGATFLSGSPRATTNINYTAMAPNTHTVNMPARTYPAATEPWDIIDDCARASGKQYFLTPTHLFYDVPTSTAYAAGLAIDDRPGFIDNITTFAPDFGGPSANAARYDGTEFLTGGGITYGTNKIVKSHILSRVGNYDWWEQVVADLGAVTAAHAKARLNALLGKTTAARPTFPCTLLLREDQVDLVAQGQTLSFRAAAAGITTPLFARVAGIKWEPFRPGLYRAHLQIGLTKKTVPQDIVSHGGATVNVQGVTAPYSSITDSFDRDDAAVLGVADCGRTWVNDLGTGSILDNQGVFTSTGLGNQKHLPGPWPAAFHATMIVAAASGSGCFVNVDVTGHSPAYGGTTNNYEFFYRDTANGGPSIYVQAIDGSGTTGTLLALGADIPLPFTMDMRVDSVGVSCSIAGNTALALFSASTVHVQFPPTDMSGNFNFGMSAGAIGSTVTIDSLNVDGVPGLGTAMPPDTGMPIPSSRVGLTNGSNRSFTTPFDYEPGSLVVTAGGVPVPGITEVDAAAGTFLIPAELAATIGVPIDVSFKTATGASTATYVLTPEQQLIAPYPSLGIEGTGAGFKVLLDNGKWRYINQLQGIVGIPGLAGEDASDWPTPGPQGQTGTAGSAGPAGPSGMGIPGIDGEDAVDWLLPGQQGPAGPVGPQGPLGPGQPGQDGDDAYDWPIPGNAGLTGTSGPPGPAGTGSPGSDGDDAYDWPIPGSIGQTGSQGLPGPSGIGIPGIDGDDAFDWPIPGNAGSPGSAGSAGATGPAGQGIPGVDGDDAFDWPVPGNQGTPGQTGPTGATGQVGVPGVDGDDAFDWPIPGNQGTPGATGSPGITGAAGVGVPGIDGDDGVDWPLPGNQGTPGATGATGANGLDGRSGVDGVDGDDAWPIPGQAGSPGATGPQGIQGFNGVGTPGIDGEDGVDWPLPGNAGVNGATGPTGASGLNGNPGQDGEDGTDWPIPGNVGPVGATGPAGMGLPGLDGDDGVDWPLPGNAGAPGQIGPAGADGSAGRAGSDGADGDDGQVIPGPVGLTGPQGPQGPQGQVGLFMVGIDGEDGNDWPVPGPVGPTGPQGSAGSGGGTIGPPGIDGDEPYPWPLGVNSTPAAAASALTLTIAELDLGGAPLTLVPVQNVPNNNASATSVPTTIAAPAVGHSIVVMVSNNTGDSAIASGQGGVTVWNVKRGVGGAQDNEIWWGIVDGTPTTSITITTAVAARFVIRIIEYPVALIADQQAVNFATSTIIDSGGVTPTTGNQLVVSTGVAFTAITGGPSNGWTDLGQVASASFTMGCAAIQQGPSPSLADTAWTIASTGWNATIVSFKIGIVGFARHNGHVQITGLSGLTAGKAVLVQQAAGPYTGKGTRADEAEMDAITAVGKVLNSTTIDIYWASQYRVMGNVKFQYVVSA